MSEPRQRRRHSIEVEGVSHGGAPIPMGARVGNTIYSSAIMGKDAATDTLPAGAEEQAKHVFANLRTLLTHGGATLDDVVHMRVTLADNAHRAALNAEWLAAFPDPHDRPARHTVLQPLTHGMLMQIEIVAIVPD